MGGDPLKKHHQMAVCQMNAKMIPSRKRSHIPTWEKEHHLQQCVGEGYVTSREGNPSPFHLLRSLGFQDDVSSKTVNLELKWPNCWKRQVLLVKVFQRPKKQVFKLFETYFRSLCHSTKHPNAKLAKNFGRKSHMNPPKKYPTLVVFLMSCALNLSCKKGLFSPKPADRSSAGLGKASCTSISTPLMLWPARAIESPSDFTRLKLLKLSKVYMQWITTSKDQ